jgi:hypothetical protein
MLDCPFYILHYKKNEDRRLYLENCCAGQLQPVFIEDFDREDIDLDEYYRFDEDLYAEQVFSIKDQLIAGTLQQGKWKDCLWADKVRSVQGETILPAETWRQNPWMRPYPLSGPDISLILKHKLTWSLIAEGSADYAIIAEDDIVLFDHSLEYVARLLSTLPKNFDYVDIAGGVGLHPVPGDPVVNGNFYAIKPPRDRTTCCAIISRDFVRRLLVENLEIVMPIDWMLTYLFQLTQANVYWVEPVAFGHGSQMNIYASNRTDNH